jgi:integrase
MARSEASRAEGSTKKRPRGRGRARNGQGTIRYQAARNRYEARLIIDGRPRSVYAKSEAEAIKKLNELRMRQAHGLDTSATASRWTVGSWLDHWFENVVAPEAAQTTLDGYAISLNKHIKPFLGRLPLQKLTTERVELWQRELESVGRGARTRHFALQRLRTALQEATARGHVMRNVASLAKTPQQQPKKHAAPNTLDLEQLVAAMRGERLEPLFLVALGTGLRRQEVLGLTWERIVLHGPNPELRVDQRVGRIGGRLVARQGAKTEAGQRCVPLVPIVIDALRMRRAQALADRLDAGELCPDGAACKRTTLERCLHWHGPSYASGELSGYVFLSRVGTLLEPRNVNRVFERVRKRAGLTEHTLHGLRHDFCSLLMEQGVPDKVVAELAGHANPAITRRIYQHGTEAAHRDAMSRLAGQLDALSGKAT